MGAILKDQLLKPDDKRERILDAALDMFKRFGFVKTTVEEIARKAQVGKGTIYFYFKNKEDILVSLTDREMAKGSAKILEAVAREKNARNRIIKLLETTFDFFHKNELTSKVLAMDQGLVLSIIEKKNKEYQRLSMDGLEALLREGQADGSLRKVDARKIAYIIDGLVRSFHYLHYLGLDIYKPEEIIGPCMDLLFSGIEKK